MTTDTTEAQVLSTESAWDLLGTYVPEPDWLIEGFIPVPGDDGMPLMIGGPPKSFKSTIAIELAVSLSTGLPFLGHYPVKTRPANVLYIDEENSRANHRKTLSRIIDARLGTNLAEQMIGGDHVEAFALEELLRWQIAQLTELTGEELGRLEFVRKQRLKLANLDDRQSLVDTIVAGDFDWVILDSLYRLVPGMDIDKGSGASQVVDWLEVIRSTGANVIVLHHAGKSRPTGAAGDRLMHSTYLRAWYETLLFMSRRGDRIVEVQTEHRELPGDDEPRGIQLVEPGVWNVDVELNAATREKGNRQDQVRDWLEPRRGDLVSLGTKIAAARLLADEWWYTESEETAKRDLEALGLWS